MNFDHWRHYVRGWLLHFFGREDAAGRAFTKALAFDPGDVKVARHLAGIAAARTEWAVAAGWYRHVLEWVPEEAETWFNLGFVCERGGQPEAALTAFATATRLQPALDRAWFGMGLAHAVQAQHATAAEAFEQAVSLQPLNGEAYYQLGMAYQHAGQPDAVRRIVMRLADFEPQRARRLAQDAGREDLVGLLPETPF